MNIRRNNCNLVRDMLTFEKNKDNYRRREERRMGIWQK